MRYDKFGLIIPNYRPLDKFESITEEDEYFNVSSNKWLNVKIAIGNIFVNWRNKTPSQVGYQFRRRIPFKKENS